jgi:hypothetical protein
MAEVGVEQLEAFAATYAKQSYDHNDHKLADDFDVVGYFKQLAHNDAHVVDLANLANLASLDDNTQDSLMAMYANHQHNKTVRIDLQVGQHDIRSIMHLASAIWAVVADLPDGTPCVFGRSDMVSPMVLGFFQGGRAVLDCPLLCHLATTTRMTYDATVATVMVCSMVEGKVHNWMRDRFAPVHAAASQPGVDGLVYFGRCVAPAGYRDA